MHKEQPGLVVQHVGPVRYRHLQQAFSSRLGKFDGERLAVLGDAVGGVEQLAHCGDEGELGWFSTGNEAVIERLEPGVAPDRAHDGHPQRPAQAGVAHGCAGGTTAGILAGLLEAGHHADIGRERSRTLEARRVTYGGDDAGGCLRADAVDGEQQLADLVALEQAVDVALDLDQAPAPKVEVLADVAGLQPIRRPVVLTDGAFGGFDQLGGPLGSDQMAPVVAQLGQPFRRGADELVRGGAFGKECGRQHAVQPAHVAGELGEAQVHQAVELAHAVVEVLPDAVAMTDQLAQGFSRGIVQLRGLGTLVKGEAGNAGGVDCIGLGAPARCPGSAGS